MTPDNQKHYETDGEFAGLWVRTATVLRKNGITTKARLVEYVDAGDWYSLCRLKGCGKLLDREIRHWLRR